MSLKAIYYACLKLAANQKLVCSVFLWLSTNLVYDDVVVFPNCLFDTATATFLQVEASTHEFLLCFEISIVIPAGHLVLAAVVQNHAMQISVAEDLRITPVIFVLSVDASTFCIVISTFL